jgi:hypothetical protein
MSASFQRRSVAGALVFACAATIAGAQNHPRTTFFGGNAHDRVQGCAVDAQGRILVTGNTGSNNFSQVLPPLKGGFQKNFQGGSDAFVGILSADLSTVIAWTYLGGVADERGYGIQADAQGRIWVVGFTESPNFPTTNGTHWKGNKDAFVARFSADLKQLQMCTLVGGTDHENPRGSFALDANDNVYISGSTGSLDFPTTTGVYQKNHAPGGLGSWDGFVTKLDVNGHVVWSTYLGGSGQDAAYSGLRLASDGSIVVAGMTSSTDFPATPGAFQTTYGGDGGTAIYSGDGFVARLSADGKQLIYATYLGGSQDDSVTGNDSLELDDYDQPIVIGLTASQDFPMVSTGWSTQHKPGIQNDGFIVELSADGSQMLKGTFIGGSEDEELSGLDIDSSGNVYVSGNTSSGNFPVTLDAVQPTYAGYTDAIIVKFSAELDELLYSTFLGGSGNTDFGDRGRTLALNQKNEVVISGDTDSPNFPTTSGTFDPYYDGGISDGFVTTESLGDTYVLGKGKKTSQNKFATLSWKGVPSAAANNFSIDVKNGVPNQRGNMVWGPAISPIPFKGGTLYPGAPWTHVKTKVLDSTGSVSYAIALDPTMIGETRVYQFLFGDPAQSDGTKVAMSNALKVVFTP